MKYDIPYEILKLAIPEIQEKVNRTLHNFAPFKIEFCLHPKKNKTKQKRSKQKKSGQEGIDVNIYRDNTLPYNIQWASENIKTTQLFLYLH